MKLDTEQFQKLISTLEQQGDLRTVVQATAGRPQRLYQLLGETNGH
jgi:predicted ArsR family transcriptional regulator